MSFEKKKEPSELAFRDGSSGGVGVVSTSSDSSKENLINQSCVENRLSELDSKFTPKKKAASILARSFWRLGEKTSKIYPSSRKSISPYKKINHLGFTKRALKVKDCGSFLECSKGRYADGSLDDKLRLTRANFCKDRLCPMCNWRRTLNIFGQVSQILDYLSNNYRFLFLTLTIPNCTGDNLSSTIDAMNKAFYRLKRNKRVKDCVLGFHRSLEVTINKRNETYHPHFHIILAVPKSYFDSKKYIKQSEWLQLWRDAMNDQSITQVDIRAIKPRYSDSNILDNKSDVAMKKAVAEASKYAVKDSEFLGKYDKDGNLIKPYSEEVIDDRVYHLALALKNRQLSVFGGVLYEAQKALNLDDSEDGDLIHVSDEIKRPFVSEIVFRYRWNIGVSAYEEIEFFERPIKEGD